MKIEVPNMIPVICFVKKRQMHSIKIPVKLFMNRNNYNRAANAVRGRSEISPSLSNQQESLASWKAIKER